MAYNKTTIQSLQSAVNAAGYTPMLAVDGVLGPKTTAGIKWLQQTSSYSRTDGVPDDGFLANLGITPGKAGYAGGAAGSAGGLHLPPPNVPKQNVLPSDDPSLTSPPGPEGPPLLNVKPPLPPAPHPVPPPAPAPPPVAQHHISAIPAVVGAGAGAGVGFAVAGPVGAALGAVVGGFAGFLLGEKTSSPSMGAEPGDHVYAPDRADGSPTTRYFSTSLATLAHQPARFYRLAPPQVVNAASSWAARALSLPKNAMGVPVYRMGEWEARRSGRNVSLFGPPFGAVFGWGARP